MRQEFHDISRCHIDSIFRRSSNVGRCLGISNAQLVACVVRRKFLSRHICLDAYPDASICVGKGFFRCISYISRWFYASGESPFLVVVPSLNELVPNLNDIVFSLSDLKSSLNDLVSNQRDLLAIVVYFCLSRINNWSFRYWYKIV